MKWITVGAISSWSVCPIRECTLYSYRHVPTVFTCIYHGSRVLGRFLTQKFASKVQWVVQAHTFNLKFEIYYYIVYYIYMCVYVIILCIYAHTSHFNTQMVGEPGGGPKYVERMYVLCIYE